tara:strand:- start:649 stop:1110 length:462 start_codon:yes stop_codon:yes gene_type:complete
MLATNCIEVTGGYQGQRNRVESVATFCVEQLLPKFRTLELDFHLGNYEQTENIMGSCLHVHGNEFQIAIDKKQKLYDLILTVCHEMVHVKQYARKELKEDYPRTLWFNKEYTDGRCYPWELEAWKMQKILAHNYIKQQKLGTITVLKSLDKRS